MNENIFKLLLLLLLYERRIKMLEQIFRFEWNEQ